MARPPIDEALFIERFGPHPKYEPPGGWQSEAQNPAQSLVKTHCCFCGQQCGIQLKVRDNQVIARGRNQGRTKDDPTAHGEMEAIHSCLADHGSQALVGSTLYTSGEPCAMCMGAILWCHIGRLVFAASVQQLSTKIEQIMISSADLAAKASFAPISITGGVLAAEEMELFK